MSSQPPVDWTAVKPEATGDRHYKGAGLGTGPWKCPACAADNSGPVERGCVSCGSGSQAPTHVGVDPILNRKGQPIEHVSMPPPVVTGETEAVGVAFHHWVRAQPVMDTAAFTLCLQAFKAGIAFAEKNLLQHMPTEEAKVDLPLAGSRESRTIIAALKFFSEQILKQGPEEVTNGEWLAVPEVEDLIKEMEQ